jgi:TfoX/Sxy family transcriptional regulator of competence genes
MTKDELDAFITRAGGEPRGKFGSNGLKANGKLFALYVRGKLVLKLPRERVDALVAAGAGTRFDAGKGRPMKEWLVVEKPRRAWLALAGEAHDFVARAAPKKR